jgi:hypothetical protein
MPCIQKESLDSLMSFSVVRMICTFNFVSKFNFLHFIIKNLKQDSFIIHIGAISWIPFKLIILHKWSNVFSDLYQFKQWLMLRKRIHQDQGCTQNKFPSPILSVSLGFRGRGQERVQFKAWIKWATTGVYEKMVQALLIMYLS